MLCTHSIILKTLPIWGTRLLSTKIRPNFSGTRHKRGGSGRLDQGDRVRELSTGYTIHCGSFWRRVGIWFAKGVFEGGVGVMTEGGHFVWWLLRGHMSFTCTTYVGQFLGGKYLSHNSFTGKLSKLTSFPPSGTLISPCHSTLAITLSSKILAK